MIQGSGDGRFLFLDGMRGIAALAVVILHAGAVFHWSIHINAPLAVDFFFCLSGFVIAHAYDRRIEEMGVGRFMAIRIRRLYPMLFAGMALAVIAVFARSIIRDDTDLSLWEALPGFLMIPILSGLVAFPFNIPMWSLFFEIVANLGYALERARLSNAIFGTLVLISGIMLGALIFIAGQLHTFGLGGKTFPLGFVRVAFSFGLGIWFHRTEIYRLVPSLPRWIIAIALAVSLCTPFGGAIMDVLLVLFIMPGLLLLGSAALPGALDKLWARSGDMSYPLYIVHWPVLVLTSALFGDDVVMGAIGIGASLLMAFVALNQFDQPVRTWLKGRNMSRTATT